MSKFSVVYVKQHPVMFGAIFLVFGLLLWVLLSRGASPSSSSASTTATGAAVDPNVLAAQVQLQEAQISAQTQVDMGQLSLQANAGNNSTQVTLAGLALQAQLDQIQADHQLNEDQLTTSLAGLQSQLANNLAVTHDNNQFMIDYAKDAQDAANTQVLIGADLQKALSADQLKAYTVSSLAGVIPTLSHKNGEQNQAFDILARAATGDSSIPVAPLHAAGFTLDGVGSILGAIAPVALAFA